jgi:hypothetical protein
MEEQADRRPLVFVGGLRLASAGHTVVAVDPATQMPAFARRLSVYCTS